MLDLNENPLSVNLTKEVANFFNLL